MLTLTGILSYFLAIQAAVSKDKKKEEEGLIEADAASVAVATAKGKIADTEASREAEEARVAEIHEGLRGATQGMRDSLESTQAQVADAERATASIQVQLRILGCNID